MRLGLALGYASPGTNPTELIALAQEAERLGYDSAWTAEAWGTDAVTVLAWLGAATTTIKLGTGIMQIPARTPAMTAMTAATLDLMSGGRVLLGLGTSGPQVVEGWHGQPFGKPLGRTREYVEIVRAAIRRELLEHTGAHYEIPYAGDDATGLGIPLKLMLRPVRTEIPVYLAAIGPRNVALATEIADGWLPVWASPGKLADVFEKAFETRWRDHAHQPAGSFPSISISMRNSARRENRCAFLRHKGFFTNGPLIFTFQNLKGFVLTMMNVQWRPAARHVV